MVQAKVELLRQIRCEVVQCRRLIRAATKPYGPKAPTKDRGERAR